MNRDDWSRFIILALGLVIITAVILAILGVAGFLRQYGIRW